MVWQFDHRYATYEGATEANLRAGILPQSTSDQKADPSFTVRSRYWIGANEVESQIPKTWKQKWFLGFRRITSSVVERTMIASIFPRVGASDVLPLCLVEADESLTLCLLANFNSLSLDYAARQKVGGTHMDFHYLKQLPVLPPDFYRAADVAYVASRVLELVYTADDMQPLANALRNSPGLQFDVPQSPYRWDEARRALLRSELDAWYARAYGLTRDELRYILDPADVYGSDFPGETFRVLKEKEQKLYGEYRTRRLVLEAWDRLTSTAPVISTPPAKGILDLPVPSIPTLSRQPMDTPEKYIAQFILSMLKLNGGPIDARRIADAFSLVSSRKLCENLAKIQFDRLGNDWMKAFNENTRPELFREILCELYDKEIIGLADRNNKPTVWIKMSDPVPSNDWVELDAILSARLVANVPEGVHYQHPVSMPSNTLEILERAA